MLRAVLWEKFLHNLGLYIHIPFCKRKCAYCDFYSLTMGENLKDEYLSALTGDIKKWGGLIDRPFDTVYFGGGTPSILESDISPLLASIKENFNISENAEITAEVNPDVSELFLESAYSSGVNRISVGIESSNDVMLNTLGRTHNRNGAEKAVKRIKNAGFQNISADLMIGLPQSSIKTVKEDIDFLVSLNIPHISAYILKVEENTKFAKSGIEIPDNDEQANQYLFMCSELEKHGFLHYEISNFAKQGFESRHNLKYWNCEEYLGLGPSAHSFIDGKRFFYKRDIKSYIKSPKTEFDSIGGTDEEKLMLKLRLKKGIDLSDNILDNIKGSLQPFLKSDYIKLNGNNLSLTDKGMLVSNLIITELSELIL